MSELLIEISKLSINQRLELAQAILRSIALDRVDNAQSEMLLKNQQTDVEKQVDENETSMDLSQSQISALLLRRDEVLSGKVKTIPAEDVKAKLTAKYGLQN